MVFFAKVHVAGRGVAVKAMTGIRDEMDALAQAKADLNPDERLLSVAPMAK